MKRARFKEGSRSSHKRGRGRLRNILIFVLIVALLSSTTFLLIWGLPSFFTRIPSISLSQINARILKGGSSLGYKLGFIGTALLIAAQLYSFRKRLHFKIGSRIGTVAKWLTTHCYINIVAPILILIHSGFPFSFTYANFFRYIRLDWGVKGLVGFEGLAAWLVLISTFSGFFGRYFYGRIDFQLKGWFRHWRIFHITVSGMLYISGMIHLIVAVWFKYISAV